MLPPEDFFRLFGVLLLSSYSDAPALDLAAEMDRLVGQQLDGAIADLDAHRAGRRIVVGQPQDVTPGSPVHIADGPEVTAHAGSQATGAGSARRVRRQPDAPARARRTSAATCSAEGM